MRIIEGEEILKVDPEGLRLIARQAFHDVAFMLRPEHNEMVAKILNDPEASTNDKSVALTMLLNADVAKNQKLPFCQDTGTAIVVAKKGRKVWVDKTADGSRISDEEALQHGVYDTYTTDNLRYSQTIPLDMYKEKNSGNNLPAQVDIYATEGGEYKFLFGSANKTFLFQETKALLNPEKLENFLIEKMKTLGTAACPPYHIAFVIGGSSAETNLKTVKLASAKYYDNLPTTGDELGRAFRDIELEQKLFKAACNIGLGAQFGGKYFAVSSVCPVTVRPALSVSEYPAARTATSRVRSIRTVSGSKLWTTILSVSCPKTSATVSPSIPTVCAST